MERPRHIDLTGPTALVGMAPGDARRAVVRAVEGCGFEVGVTEARGRPLVGETVAVSPTLGVVELSRLGEVGLVGLTALARAVPATALVLLVPVGLDGPRAELLGIAAVVSETAVAEVRAVAAACRRRAAAPLHPR